MASKQKQPNAARKRVRGILEEGEVLSSSGCYLASYISVISINQPAISPLPEACPFSCAGSFPAAVEGLPPAQDLPEGSRTQDKNTFLLQCGDQGWEESGHPDLEGELA